MPPASPWSRLTGRDRDPTVEIDAMIERHRATRHQAHVELELAEEYADAASIDELRWRQRAEEAKTVIKEASREIDLLLEHRAKQIPKQRPASD